MEKAKLSEIIKLIATILVLLSIIFFSVGFFVIRKDIFIRFLFGAGGGILGLMFFMEFSPGMLVASIVLPVIAIGLMITFNIVDKDAEANIKKLDWTGTAITIASVVLMGIYYYQWDAFRQTLFLELVIDEINPSNLYVMMVVGFDFIAPGFLLYIMSLSVIIASGVILLFSRIKQKDILRS